MRGNRKPLEFCHFFGPASPTPPSNYQSLCGRPPRGTPQSSAIERPCPPDLAGGRAKYLSWFGVRLPATTPCSDPPPQRSEEHTSELQSLMRTSYAVFFLKKKK